MSMRLLLDGDFARYFDPARIEGGTWLYQHVPKTAGSSLRAEIAAELRPQANIHLDGTDPAIPHHDRLDAAVRAFVASFDSTVWRFASGHLFARHIPWIRARAPQLRLITFLRDPSARFVSDYRYQRTPMSPGHEAFRRSFPDIEAFLALGWTANQTAGYLLPDTVLAARDATAAAEWLIDSFEFVGLQEEYDLCFAAVARLLGFRRAPRERLRENPASADNPAAIPAATAARIAAAHDLDHALVGIIRARFEVIRAPLAAWLAEEARRAA